MKNCKNLACLALAALVLSFGGCKKVASSAAKDSKDSKGAKDGKEVGGVMDAAKICGDYKAGVSTADGNYKGKEVTIKGKVLNLRGKDLMLTGGDKGLQVRCMFTDDSAAGKKKDDEVKVKGTCKGMQGTGADITVILEKCSLVK